MSLLSLIGRVREARTQPPGDPVFMLWRDPQDTDADVEAAIAAATTAGRINAQTAVQVVSWSPPT
jgi:hypothetical protein